MVATSAINPATLFPPAPATALTPELASQAREGKAITREEVFRVDPEREAEYQVAEEKKHYFTSSALIGAVAGVLGAVGLSWVINDKMRPFEMEVASRTRDDIFRRGGTAAALTEIGSVPYNDGGYSTGVIERFHHDKLLTDEKDKYKLARFMTNIGGKTTAVLAGFLGIMAAVTAVVWLLKRPDFKRRKEEIAAEVERANRQFAGEEKHPTRFFDPNHGVDENHPAYNAPPGGWENHALTPAPAGGLGK